MNNVKLLLRSLQNNKLYNKSWRICSRLSSPLRVLPDFIIVGTQKGGTSSLYAYLVSHPQILRSSHKEVHFFDKKFSKGIDWYRSNFPLFFKLREGVITGEASPYYMYHPQAAKRIASVVPNCKLIFLLRNPVNRAISHFWHEIRLGVEDLPIQVAFDKENERLEEEKEKLLLNGNYYSYAHQHFSYLDRGKYVNQIKTYLKYFPENQILILKSEDFFRDPQNVFNKVIDFLGVDSHLISNMKPRNVGTYRDKVDENLKEELRQYFQPWNEKLYKLLNTDLKW